MLTVHHPLLCMLSKMCGWRSSFLNPHSTTCVAPMRYPMHSAHACATHIAIVHADMPHAGHHDGASPTRPVERPCAGVPGGHGRGPLPRPAAQHIIEDAGAAVFEHAAWPAAPFLPTTAGCEDDQSGGGEAPLMLRERLWAWLISCGSIVLPCNNRYHQHSATPGYPLHCTLCTVPSALYPRVPALAV